MKKMYKLNEMAKIEKDSLAEIRQSEAILKFNEWILENPGKLEIVGNNEPHEQKGHCILDRAWDSAKSFVSGIIWIFIILSIIGLIFG